MALALVASAVAAPSAHAATFSRVFRLPEPIWDFSEPQDAVRDHDGTIWLVDKTRQRLIQLTPDGHELMSIGGPGGTDGYFEGPRNIALGPDGLVYVIDGSGRLQRFTKDGVFVSSVRVENLSPYYTPSLSGLSIDTTGSVYVSDSWTGAVQKLREDGTTECSYVGALQADDVVVAADGTVYVSDSDNEVLVFSPDGTLAGRFAVEPVMGPYQRPSGLALDPDGTLLVAVSGGIVRMSTSGEYLGTVAGAPPDNIYALPTPGGISVDGDGGILWTASRHTLHVIAPDGTPVGSYRSDGTGPFSTPNGFAFFGDTTYVTDGQPLLHRVDANGAMFASGEGAPSLSWRSVWPSVVNYVMHQPLAVTPQGDVLTGQVWTYQCDEVVRRFTAEGEHVGDFGTFGSGPGQTNYISSIAVDSEGRIFVADLRNRRVQWFSPEGVFWGEFGGTRDTPFGQVRAVGFDDQGRLWVGHDDTVAVFGVSGITPPSIDVTPAVPAIDESSTVVVEATPGENSTIDVQASEDGATWETLSRTRAPDNGRVSMSGVRFDQATHVRALERSSRGDRVIAYSRQLRTVPKAIVGTPVAPDVVVRGASFTVRSSVRPVHGTGTYPVSLHYWHWENGHWASYGSVKGRSTALAKYSRVEAKMKLPLTGRWRIRAYHGTDSDNSAAWSPGHHDVTVKMLPSVGRPHAPDRASRGVLFRVYGSLAPRHREGSHPVRVYRWRKSASGAWRSYGYVRAKVTDRSGHSRYSATMRLDRAGTWRVRAYAPADGSHVARWSSGYDYIRVR